MDHSRSNPNTTMRAVRCHRFADVEPTPKTAKQQQQRSNNRRPSFRPRKPGPLRLRDCLSLERLSLPTVVVPNNNNNNNKETTIVIRTEYAGIQYPDALQARGLYQIKPKLPYTPGMDVVGVVLKVVPPRSTTTPPSSTRIQPGDRVMATLLNSGGTGGLSEIVVAPLKFVYKLPLPKTSSPRSGAAFANIGRNYFAAYHSLVEVGSIDPSAKTSNASKIVLVTGASGGVGMATIELAKAMGCTVIAGVGTPSKKDAPESVGADLVLCYGRTKAARRAFRSEVLTHCRHKRARGVDLVVDVVFGELFGDALVGCLKPLGTIALVGFAAGQKSIKPGILLVKEARVAGSLWSSVAIEASETNPNNKYRRMVETILCYLGDGSIRGRVDRVVPLQGFLEAFEIFEENKGRGNTVVSFLDNDDEDTNNRGRSRL